MDLLSFLLGLIIGIAITVGAIRLLPTLLQLRDQSLDRVQETQAWVRAGVEKRFQAETEEYVQRFHLGRSWARLEALFITPSIVAPLTPPTPETAPDPVPARLNYLWPEVATAIGTPPPPLTSIRQLLLNGRRVVLSAPPGSGKTTLLAYCAYLCTQASDKGPYTFLLPLIPVLTHLAELDLDEGSEDAVAPLVTALQERAGPLTAPGIGSLLRKKMEAGQVLLLLDGGDELGASGMEAVAGWLKQLLKQYPTTQIIAAAGARGYEPLLYLGFTLTGLFPWRSYQADHLGELWAESRSWSRRPRLEQYWQPGRSALSTFLYLWQHQENQLEPVSSSQQKEILQATLEHLLPAPTEEIPQLPQLALSLWEELAYQTLVEEKQFLSRPAVEQQVQQLLLRHGLDSRGAGLLRKTVQSSPLFLFWRGDSRLGFLSSVWRDYLAARRLVRAEQHQLVLENLEHYSWAGSIGFYAALGDAGSLANRLLDARSADPFRQQLFQAAGWLPDTEDGAEWRRQALIQLGQLIVKPEVPPIMRQRAIASVAQSEENGVLALLRQLLQRSDPELRQGALAALACIEPELSVPLIERMLKDENPQVRAAAVHAVGWQHSLVGENTLLAALISRDELTSRAAAEQLALNGGEDWDVLREAAGDDELHVRRAATYGLRLLDEYWAVQLLEEMERNDLEWAVQTAATVALEEIAGRNRQAAWVLTPAGDLPWLIDWAASQERAVPAGNAALAVLRDALQTAQRWEIRAAAARSLPRVFIPLSEKPPIIEALRQAVRQDPDVEVQDAAFTALAELHRAQQP